MEQQRQNNQENLYHASLSDFGSIDLSDLLATVQKADGYAMEMALQDELRKATERGDEAAERALRVLALVSTFHLQVEDPGTPFAPRWSSPGGRSYQPSDFRGEQNNILAEVVPSIGHPALRARVADIAWFNDRKHWKMGSEAVQAYCDLVVKRISGELSPAFDGLDDTIGDAVDFLHRSLQIAAASGNGVTFYWSEHANPSTWEGIRVPGSDPETRRGIDEISLEELGNAAAYILKQQGGTSQDGLAKAVCRLLGVARTTAEAGARISRALTHGRVQTVMAVEDGSVRLRK